MTSVEPISSPHVQDSRPRAIGLCMIVKNEAHVIERCLNSVKPLVDYVLVEDTGSTDGTQQLVTEWLRRNKIPGVVIDEPWRDFAYNRSHALTKLREVATVDYALIIDADDRLVTEPGFDPAAYKADMREDLYDIQIRHGSSRFYRPQLFANRLAFSFKAVLHEYLEAPPGKLSRANAKGFHIETGRGGARNKNPRKYQDDAAALERALRTETDPFLISRYRFYLAQSYRDCGEREKALENYMTRANLGYWIEEVFESLYCAAKLQEALEFPAEEVIATYLRATDAVPTRAEALHGLSQFCRSKGRNEEGFQYAKRGLAIPQPEGGLFVESWIYDYGLLDELGINGYWSGHFRESLDACLRLLGSAALPADQRQRVSQNARFALEKLPKELNLGSAGQSTLAGRHALTAERPLRSRVIGAPRILLAILAKQKEDMLPLHLDCIEALDYPKSSICLYIRTNNNTDGTERLLREWVERVGHLYADVEFDASDVTELVQQFGVHEWNATRFQVLGRIRNISLQRALERGCDFYFVADVDNFIRPATLRELVALNLPIVAPLLRSLEPGRFYSNYHAETDGNGYYRDCDQYMWVLNQWISGVIEMPVVHTTYLIRSDVIPDLSYVDETSRHEYVVFSDVARKAKIPQYLDNRQVYGYIAFGEGSDQHVVGGIERARSLLAKDLSSGRESGPAGARALKAAGVALAVSVKPSSARPRVFACFGLHSSGSTWMYNLVREICAAGSIPFVSTHRDSSANLPWEAPGAPLIVAKTHNPMADFQALIGRSADPVVITLRDPRDAVVSFMQRFPNSLGASLDQALAAIALSAERLVAVSRLKHIPVFRYEDGFVGSPETVDQVAAMLGVDLAAERRDAILQALSPDEVRETIGRLEASGAIQGEAVWDRETHWHANHIGDGKVGKWREALTQAQAQKILDRTREYYQAFGYAEPSGALKVASIAGERPGGGDGQLM
jgi:glycosyltransferase involved in cell wall biosynthesis